MVRLEYHLRESRLRWYDHVHGRPRFAPLKAFEKIVTDNDMVGRRWGKDRSRNF